MNNSFFTPKRLLFALGIVAGIFLFRFCSQQIGDNGNNPEEVNIRQDAAAVIMNPFLTQLGVNIYICARIFQGMCDLDPKSLELKPVLIKAIPQSRVVKDGPHQGELAYDFEILPEAQWDNGTPVTGKDLEFSFKIIFNPLLPTKAFTSYYEDMSGMEVDPANPKKFTIYFKKYYILTMEALTQFPILPSYNYDPNQRLAQVPLADLMDTSKVAKYLNDPGMKAFADEFQQPKFANDPNFVTGSGPYRLQTANDQGTILVKKENWWGDKLAEQIPLLGAYPKRLVYKVVKDENVIENMLKNGELDIVAGSLSPSKFMEMKQKDSLATNYNFDVMKPIQYNRWLINTTKPILKDLRVRKAMAHIVDYDHLIKNIRSGLGARVVSNILPSKRYYAKDIVPYDFNIQKAKDLLAEAGWADSDGDGYLDKMMDGKKTKLVIELLVTSIKSSQLYAESITETARLAGIEIKSVPTDLTEVTPKTKIGDYETAFIATAFFPGLTEMRQRYHSKSLAPAGDNRSLFVNPKLDSLIELIAAEENEAKRDQLYIQAQQILHEELPEVFLFTPDQPIITSKKFEAVLTDNRPGYYEQLFRLK